MHFATQLLAVALALLANCVFAAMGPMVGKSSDMMPFSHWMPSGGKCVMTGVGLYLCKNLPKQDVARIRNGTCTQYGPDYISCGPQAEPFIMANCVPSGPGVFRCGREDMLQDRFFCLEAWEGVHMCKEEKPLVSLPKVPGALGG